MRQNFQSASYLFIILLSVSVAAQPVGTPLNHQNYDTEPEDFSSVHLAFERCLGFAENTLLVVPEQPKKNLSLRNNLALLRENLRELVNITLDIEDRTRSYFPLLANSSMFLGLEKNISRLLTAQNSFLANISLVEMELRNPARALSALTTAREQLYQFNNSLTCLWQNSYALRQQEYEVSKIFHALEQIQIKLNEYQLWMTRYSHMLLPETYLSMNVKTNIVQLTDFIECYGYLFGNGDFVPNYPITVIFENQSYPTHTDSNGRYNLSIGPLKPPVRKTKINATAWYNNTRLWSEDINLTIKRMQTILNAESTFPEYEPGMTVNIFGTLKDARSCPVTNVSVIMQLGALCMVKFTDDEGKFNVGIAAVPLGLHKIFCSFNGTETYESASTMLELRVNIPTVLHIYVVQEQKNVIVTGELRTKNGTPISNQQVEIIIKKPRISERTTTTSDGKIHHKLATGLQPGVYEFYAEFNPTDAKWRRAISDTVRFEFLQLSEDDLILKLVLIAAFITVGTGVAIYLLRKRRRQPAVPARRTGYLPEKRERVEVAVHDTGPDWKTILALEHDPRLIIIKGYNCLLAHLRQKLALELKPSLTHREIQSVLAEKLSPPAIEKITIAFEKAMYSGYSIDRRMETEFTAVLDTIMGGGQS